jgi:hypothetical protein
MPTAAADAAMVLLVRSEFPKLLSWIGDLMVAAPAYLDAGKSATLS